MAAQEIRVPDIGDFSDVPIIEIHVAPGDTVAAEDPLLTLESDKATLDVPSPVAGTIGSLAVAVGDRCPRARSSPPSRSPAAAARRTEGAVTSQPAAHPGGGAPRDGGGPAGGADGACGLRVVGGAAHPGTTGHAARRWAPRPVHRAEG